MKTRDASSKERKAENPKMSAGHKLAEWVSLGLSVLLILVVAGYLLFEAFQANEPFVPVEVQLREAREVNGRFLLPVRVANRGQQTLRDLKIEVRYQPRDSASETTDLLIDYLGERSEQTTYFYFDQHPSTMKVEARARSYRLD